MTTHQQIISATQLTKLVSSWVNREEINMKIASGELIQGTIISLELIASDNQNEARRVVANIAKGDQSTITELTLDEKDQQGDNRQVYGWTPKGQGGF